MFMPRRDKLYFRAFLFFFFGAIFFVALFSSVFAAPPPGNTADASTPIIALENFKNLDQWNGATPQTLVGRFIDFFFLSIMGSVALGFFVYGGILWMTSAGNSERRKKGMLVLVWAAFGSIAVLSSYALVTFVLDILK
ncbi:MAG TPA: hypothetical protein DCY48_02640 [Candidatus Magasanikbacteria bacterium]|nr:MAG: hypothetical protein A3I74_02910 [Candidatus Magasanikbacteria bacterium RIFCSPLOWO2_02_FULL_47_16]OGH79559.1 MAG: hypothetical protein A3C10_00495 [Candidatus Magasanikbacteria bacterium RIFCSPHIGHO2_02_FULL_48_18]HAZ28650.1 hypothetical protein [Candidatus Magasanikbacteria bacterium]